MTQLQEESQVARVDLPEIKRLLDEETQPCTSHPYLEKNGIADPGDLRVLGDALVIPMRTMRDRCVNFQLIDPAGRMSYVKGAELKGTFSLFASRPKVKRNEKIYICEGWANGWTIHDATNSVVVAVFERDQLPTVASEIRRRYPGLRIVVAAVNERWSYVQHGGRTRANPGLIAARAASERTRRERLAIPDFEDLDGRPTSFNGLRLREGREAVVRWLNAESVLARCYLEGHDVLANITWARFPESAELGGLMHVGAVIGEVADGSTDTRASRTPKRLLGSIGLKVDGDALLVANRGGWLHSLLENRWPKRRWMSLLRELPDTRATGPKYFPRGEISRATFVPLSLLWLRGARAATPWPPNGTMPSG